MLRVLSWIVFVVVLAPARLVRRHLGSSGFSIAAHRAPSAWDRSMP